MAWVRRKIYWINLAGSIAVAALVSRWLEPIASPPLAYPVLWGLIFWMTAYPFFRKLVHAAGGRYTFIRHVAGAVVGVTLSILVWYVLS